jgi:hypothetical protein
MILIFKVKSKSKKQFISCYEKKYTKIIFESL